MKKDYIVTIPGYPEDKKESLKDFVLDIKNKSNNFSKFENGKTFTEEDFITFCEIIYEEGFEEGCKKQKELDKNDWSVGYDEGFEEGCI